MPGNYLPKPYHTKLWRAIMEFGLIDPDDRVLVGLSGGKDSAFMLYALNVLRGYSEVPFDLQAVTVDLGFTEPLDSASMGEYCGQLGVPYHVIKTQIADIIDERSPKESPCAVCSFFRRAAMNRFAAREGFTKVALAHHLDDACETFLMNLLYSGRILALPWKTHLSRTGVTVIRPLLYFSEREVIRGTRLTGFEPVSNPCPHSGHSVRARVRHLLRELSRENKMVRANIISAMREGKPVELWPPARRHRH
ncbi:MAG: tRNA 2-thiocytidine biosynthesis TtcA family protein [Firmicutes bacterium]|jgi:tRNA(Ile)-lysidine synthase TilS/MesJ|nr:tRNA 2-thiocytidine biosynthesis TtcA family protein [Bacillota bacterium]